MKKYKENEEQREQFTREQREAGRKQNRVSTMPGSDASVPSLGTDASEFSGMFSGSADLAIQRKMDAASKTD